MQNCFRQNKIKLKTLTLPLQHEWIGKIDEIIHLCFQEKYFCILKIVVKLLTNIKYLITLKAFVYRHSLLCGVARVDWTFC